MADDDEDWFERALREDDDETPDTDEPTEPDSGEEPDATPEPDDADESDAGGDEFADAFGVDDGDTTDTAGSAGSGGDDFASAFGMDDAGGTGASGSAGGGGEFGFDLDDNGDNGGSGEFGFDLDGDTPQAGASTDEFDEEFESDIPRIDLGIDGLDAMVQGGVPERSLIVAIGSAGTGKTTFGLQFLNEAIRNDERAVYITLEETRERIVQSAAEKGWPFDEYIDEDRLAVVDLDPVEMANSLQNIRNELPALIEEFGASRLVLDSVSLLEMMYDDQAVRRTEIYDFTKSLKRAGVTTMLTSEASDDNAFASRHGIIEYLTDAVIVLRYVRPEDFRETRLAIEIQKIRDANHSRETKPYEITNDGISVYRQANIF